MSRKEKRSPENKRLTIEKALNRKGYYDKNHNWNSMTTLPGYPPEYVFRNRVEVLIFNGDDIFLCQERNFFRVPGGSVERGVKDSEQVRNEAREEARLEIKNVRNTGIHYTRVFGSPYRPANSSIYWNGVHNTIYVADYAGDYEGPIANCLKDQKMLKNGKFYKIDEVFPYLKSEYRKVISIKRRQSGT